MKWLAPYLSKGRGPSIGEGRHADTETVKDLLDLRRKVRIYEDALLKIYWETNEPFVNNIAHVALTEAEKQ